VDIRLRPLRDEEFEEFLAAQHVEYARGLVDEVVWSGNEVARALYGSAGYYERAVFMSKELD
jgi:hypothetical protein